MKHYLLIDGYNIINAWSDLKAVSAFSLEEARNILVQQLIEYKSYTGENVILVFDAHLVKGYNHTKHEFVMGLEVVFTKENQTADSYIEKKVEELTKNRRNKVKVATSDWAEQQVVLGIGATRISARELKIELDMVKKNIRKKTDETNVVRSTLGDRIDDDVAQILEKWRKNQ
ncbi:MAG: NYN domain-containing protein [Alkaliphilus sp.]|nr:NYN domain-containing protein [Alkaliphilus sp.]